MRIKHTVNVKIASDADMYNLLYGPDTTRAEVTIDAYARMVAGTIKIDMSTNEDLPLGDITAVKGIFIKVDQDAVIKLNGGTETFQMRKPTTGATIYARFFFEGDITQVNIAAPAAADLLGEYCVWGDSA